MSLVDIVKGTARFTVPSISPPTGITINVYDLPLNKEHPLGGREVELRLSSIPLITSLAIPFTSTDVDLVPQPVLTAAEIARGCIRPPNVVNSVAAFRRSNIKGRVGREKLFHIHTPLLTDADGLTARAPLSVAGNNLVMSLPQAFLKSARYPVIVDPTFGSESWGLSEDVLLNDYSGVCIHYIATETWTPTNVSVALRNNSASAVSVKCALYFNHGLAANNPIEDCGIVSVPGLRDTPTWTDFPISGSSHSAGDVCISLHPNDNYLYWKYDANAGYTAAIHTCTYAAFPTSPFGSLDWSGTGYLSSAHVDYTAGGGAVYVRRPGIAQQLVKIGVL